MTFPTRGLEGQKEQKNGHKNVFVPEIETGKKAVSGNADYAVLRFLWARKQEGGFRKPGGGGDGAQSPRRGLKRRAG